VPRDPGRPAVVPLAAQDEHRAGYERRDVFEHRRRDGAAASIRSSPAIPRSLIASASAHRLPSGEKLHRGVLITSGRDVLAFLTAGESTDTLTTIIEGCPAGVPVAKGAIDRGSSAAWGLRSRRAHEVEADEVEILGGVRHGRSLGSPIALLIRDRDHANWTEVMTSRRDPAIETARVVTRPRPDHRIWPAR
jgi:hypothetical protein